MSKQCNINRFFGAKRRLSDDEVITDATGAGKKTNKFQMIVKLSNAHFSAGMSSNQINSEDGARSKANPDRTANKNGSEKPHKVKSN